MTMAGRGKLYYWGYLQLDQLMGAQRAEQLATLERTVDSFAAVFDPDRRAELVSRGRRRLSHQAFPAALLINPYRDEPIFQLPFRLLTALVDIDEGFTAWRIPRSALPTLPAEAAEQMGFRYRGEP